MEAQTRFREALARVDGRASPEVVCWGLWGQATSLRNRGEYEKSAAGYLRTMSVARSRGVLLCERWCLAGLAEIDRMRGMLPEALRAHEELAAVFRRDNDGRGLGWALSGLAQIHLNLEHLGPAEQLFQEAEEVAASITDRIGAAYAVRGRGEVALRKGDVVQAVRYAEKARHDFEVLPYAIGTAYAIRTLSHAALAQHQVEHALELALEALSIFGRLKKPRGIAYMEQTLTAIASTGGSAPPRRPIKAEGGTTAAGIWLAPLPSAVWRAL